MVRGAENDSQPVSLLRRWIHQRSAFLRIFSSIASNLREATCSLEAIDSQPHEAASDYIP